MELDANFKTSSPILLARPQIGAVQTIHGKDGKDGKSAYEIAVKNGFEGSEAEWLKSLHGEKGDNGDPGEPGYTPVRGTDYWTETDKEEIVSDTLERIIGGGGGSVVSSLFERVDALDEQATALAENDSKLSEEDTAIKERLAEVEKWIDDKDYGSGISITSFSHDAGTREMGSTIKSLNLNWGFNRTPVTQTLNGEALDVNVRSKHVDGLSITMDKSTWPTWKLTATDTRNKVVSSSVSSFTFLNGVYYGAAAQPGTIDSAFVRGLLATPVLTGSKGRTITVNAVDGAFIWYCLPKRLGTCTFKVGGFEGGFALVDTIEFTNDSKYTESYYIYQSEESGLGSTTVGVS